MIDGVRRGAACEKRGRRARLVSVRRRLGRPEDVVGISRGLSAWLHARAGGGGAVLWRGARRLDVAVGRLRQAEGGAPRVWEGAGIRDERRRVRAVGPEVLPALPRDLFDDDARLWREPVQVRRNRQRVERVPRQRVRQRLRRGDRAHRRAARGRSRISTSISRRGRIRRRSGSATRTRSGAAARITTSPASARAGSSGSRIATATPYEHVVQRGALFPLNSLMLHGLIYAVHAKNLETDPHDDFTDEIRALLRHRHAVAGDVRHAALLTSANWDTLAEAAKWSRRNAGTLVDTHWLGGDPTEAGGLWLGVVVAGEGNPDAAESGRSCRRRFALDVAQRVRAAGCRRRAVHGAQPVGRGPRASAGRLRGGSEHVVDLAPFEVRWSAAQDDVRVPRAACRGG